MDGSEDRGPTIILIQKNNKEFCRNLKKWLGDNIILVSIAMRFML